MECADYDNVPTPAKRPRVAADECELGDLGSPAKAVTGQSWKKDLGDQSMFGQNLEWETWLNQQTPSLQKGVRMNVLWRQLIAHEVLDHLTKERIELQAANAEQVARLCDLLRLASVWKWHAFVRCLVLTNQEAVVTTMGINPRDYKDPADEVPMVEELPAPQPTHEISNPQSRSIARTNHHCRFILEKDFNAGNADIQSPEYNLFISSIEKEVKVSLNDITGKTAEVYVTYVSQIKRMVFVDINCLTEEEIRRALTSSTNELTKKNHHICPDTLIFKDDIPNTVALEVVKNKHVHRDPDRKIDLDNQYVELKMINEEQLKTIQRVELEIPARYQAELQENKGTVIRDEDIVKAGEVKRHVLIRGRAGIGKTTTMQRLMWRWAHGEWARHFKAFFLLNVRILMAITTNVSLPVLLGQYSVYRLGNTTTTIHARWLEENQRQIGFVIDGLDEIFNFNDWWGAASTPMSVLTEVKPLTWAFALMKRSCLSNATLIVASRPFTALGSLKPDISVEVMGLTRERVDEYVEKNVPADRISNVKRNLKNQPILLSVSSITFYCAALCQVLQDNIDVTVKLTTYTQITAYIMEMFMRRTAEVKDVSSCLSAMCRLAYDGLVKRTKRGIAELVFDDQDFKRQNLTQEDVDNARQAGIFLQTEIPEQTSSGNKKVLGEFVHLSIQEFLAMTGLLMQSSTDVKKALKTLSTSGQYNMGLLFLYGFAFNTNSEAIQNLRKVIGAQFKVDDAIRKILEVTILDIPDQLQLLQMVHESQSAKMARDVGLKRFPEKVKFNFTKLTVVDVLAVIFLLKNHPSAVTIDLTGVGLDSFCLIELGTFLLNNRTVKNFSLNNAGIDDENVKYITDALEVNTTLTSLELIEVKCDGDRVVKLLAEAMKHNPTLTELRLSFKSVAEESMKDLSDAVRKSSLTELELTGGCADDTSMKHMANAIKHNNTITTLTINSQNLKDDGLADLAGILQTNTAITAMTLSFAPTSDGSGMEHVSRALATNKALTTLGINRDCIDDNSVKHLADAIRENQTLRKLEVSSNKVTDEGVKYLADVLRANTTMTELEITSDFIGDEGVRSLATLLQTNTTLTNLNIQSTIVKEEVAELLLQALDANKALSLRVFEADCSDDDLSKRFNEHCRIKTGYAY